MIKDELNRITLTIKEFSDEIEVQVTCPATKESLEISPKYPLDLLVPDKKEELIKFIKKEKGYTLGRCPHCQEKHTWNPKTFQENYEQHPAFK